MKLCKIIIFSFGLLLLTACSSERIEDGDLPEIVNLKNIVDEQEQKINELGEQPKGANQGEKETVEDVLSKENKKSKVKTLKIDKSVTIKDFCEFQIIGYEFTKKIEPYNPSILYTSFTSQDDEIYLDIKITITSLLESSTDAWGFLYTTILYDDKYEYTGFTVVEKKDSSDFSSALITTIDPLKTETLHFIVSVPEHIATDDKSVSAVITVNKNGKEYKLPIK